MRVVANDVFELAWSLGGSISGEHADGLVRTAFIKRQYGEKYYEVLREIKRIFDADGLMNIINIVFEGKTQGEIRFYKSGVPLLPSTGSEKYFVFNCYNDRYQELIETFRYEKPLGLSFTYDEKNNVTMRWIGAREAEPVGEQEGV